MASRDVRFYDCSWQGVYLAYDLLSEITCIPKQVLGHGVTDDISVAQKISWASNRETTREEDMAYCLMGLFDVNMPLLYGEGAKAFIRLQEETVRKYLMTTRCFYGKIAKVLIRLYAVSSRGTLPNSKDRTVYEQSETP